MKKHLLITCALILLAAPVCAKTTRKNDPALSATATVPVGSAPAQAATPVDSTKAVPVASSTPAASAAAPVEDNEPAAGRPADLSPSKVTAGDLTLSDISANVKGSVIEFSMTVKNPSKAADKIIGASTYDWPGTSITGADGKDMGNIVIPADGKVDVKLHVKDATNKQIKSAELPITFYFGRSPNTKLKIYVSGHEGLGSKIMGIFK